MLLSRLFIFTLLVVFLSACNDSKREASSETKITSTSEVQESEIIVDDTSAMTDADIKDLIISAMINNRLQTNLAALAEEKAEHAKVKAFADMIINNRRNFQYHIGRMALAYDIDIPKGLTPKTQQVFDRIEQLSSNEFDKEFIDLIIRTHRQDIKRYQRLLYYTDDILARGVVEESLETLEEHLELAEKIEENISENEGAVL